MRISKIPKLRKMIHRIIMESAERSHRQEPYEGYVQNNADMYAQDDDFDGYVEFGMKHGYTEDQLGEWFDIAYEAQYQAHVADQPVGLVRKGSLDIDQLEADFESGYIDLEKRPYQLD